MQPLRWAFFADAHNYGDCSRAIEIAVRMVKEGGVVKFYHQGGRFAPKIEETGLETIKLEPLVTEKQHAVLMAIDQHRAPITTPMPFSEEQLQAMVESEIFALKQFKPNAAYCGLNVSCSISVPYLKLPRVALVPTALCPAFFKKGLASFPNAMEKDFFLRYLVPGWVKKIIINQVMLGKVMKKAAVVYNKIRCRYGLPPLYNYPALAQGDLTLLPDLPQLSGLPAEDLTEGYKYTGPLFASGTLPIPDEVKKVFSRPGLKVFCSMGSSGSPELIKLIVSALKEVPTYNIVCGTTSIIDPKELGPASECFFATRFLPAPQVNALADLAVTHGGQGTVQTAVWAGTPVVGIGFQWEQQANLDGLVRAGVGIRIPIHSVTKERLLSAVETASSAGYHERIKGLQKLVRSCDGAGNAVKTMNAFVLKFIPS